MNQNGEWVMMNIEQLMQRHGANARENELIELRYIITTTLNAKNIDNSLKLVQPFRPPIVSLIHLANKGCSKWNYLFKWRAFTNKDRDDRERKWETKLGNRQGPYFWNRYYAYAKNISYDNKIKWIQHQVMRNSLKTNYIVAKFKDNFSPLCTFCSLSDEKIEHLFWECNLVQQLLNEIKIFFNQIWNLQLVFTKKNILFGKTIEPPTSPSNLVINYIKRFIWVRRCLKAPPNAPHFISWFKREIEIIKIAFSTDNKFAYLLEEQYSIQ